MLRIRHVRTGRGRCCSSLLLHAAALCCMRVWHATHLLLNYFCCCCCCCTCCSSCCCCCNVEIVAKLQIFSQRLRSLTPATTHCCRVVVVVVLLLCFWCTWNAVTNDFSTIIYIIFDYLLPFIDFAISFALFTFATSRCCCWCCFWFDNSFSLATKNGNFFCSFRHRFVSHLACFNIFERTSIA